MLRISDIKAGVPIATLGSIAILTASFLEKVDFLTQYKGGVPSPIGVYIFSGILLLLSSGSFLLFAYGEESQKKWVIDIFFDLPLGIGLFVFFLAAIFTLIIYFS